jgi:uncharacterized membrane protein (UPF0127 family)
MDFQVKIGGKEITIPEVKELSKLGMIKGLMFRRRERANALLFNSQEGIHSFFCFFPFLILWLDYDDNVVEFKIIKPWKFFINSKNNFSKFIEIPFNRRYKELIGFFVGTSSEKGLKMKKMY